MCGIETSETVESDQSLASQALAAAEQRASEYEGLLEDAQLKFESVAKHRKSAQKQLDAQEEDLEHLGHRLKVSFPSSRIQSLFVTNPHKCCLLPALASPAVHFSTPGFLWVWAARPLLLTPGKYYSCQTSLMPHITCAAYSFLDMYTQTAPDDS